MNDSIKNKYHIKNKNTLNQQVYDSLKKMILDGVFDPNEKLNEVQIAELLGVSATPVRESFRILFTEGLVEIIPYKGVFIREYTLEEIKEVYQCREALEILALDLATDKIKNDDIIDLINEIENYEDKCSKLEMVELSNKVHDYIVEKSGNSRIKYLLDNLNDVLVHDRNISAGDDERKTEIFKEHLNILYSISENDYESAKNFLKIHIRNGYYYIEDKKYKTGI